MDEAKARALADKLTAAVEFDVHIRDDIEPYVEIVGAEAMILAFAAEVRRDERERALVAVLRLTADDTAKYGGRQAAIDAIRALSPQAGPDPTVARFREELTAMVARADAAGWSIIPDGHAQDLEAAKRLLREDRAALKRAEAP